MKNLRGRVAIVTGAAGGIGRQIALELARHGASLDLWDINEADLAHTAELARQLGATAVVRRCDLMHPEEIPLAVAAALAEHGRVDILVNNAGVAYYGPADRMTAGQWDWVMNVNLLAPIKLIHALLPTFLAQGEAHVLNVSSIGGLVAQTRLAAYHASKFGLVGLTEALRAEYGHRGVGFTALCPCLTDTGFFDHAVIGRKRGRRRPARWLMIGAEQVARRAVRAIRGNQGLVLVGWTAHLAWIAKRLSPGLLDFIQRFRLSKPKPK